MFGFIKNKGGVLFAFLKACVIYGSEHMNRFGEEKGCRLTQKGLKQVNAFHLKHFSFCFTRQNGKKIIRNISKTERFKIELRGCVTKICLS